MPQRPIERRKKKARRRKKLARWRQQQEVKAQAGPAGSKAKS